MNDETLSKLGENHHGRFVPVDQYQPHTQTLPCIGWYVRDVVRASSTGHYVLFERARSDILLETELQHDCPSMTARTYDHCVAVTTYLSAIIPSLHQLDCLDPNRTSGRIRRPSVALTARYYYEPTGAAVTTMTMMMTTMMYTADELSGAMPNSKFLEKILVQVVASWKRHWYGP
jgi:hypothetical protein